MKTFSSPGSTDFAAIKKPHISPRIVACCCSQFHQDLGTSFSNKFGNIKIFPRISIVFNVPHYASCKSMSVETSMYNEIGLIFGETLATDYSKFWQKAKKMEKPEIRNFENCTLSIANLDSCAWTENNIPV